MKQILIEITVDQALKVLGLSQSDARDASKLKSAYKSASLKNHPDRGGSTEAMKDVNLAYELLQKYTGSSTSSGGSSSRGGSFDRDSYERSKQEYFDLGLSVLRSLKEKLKLDAFLRHFQTIYNEPFEHKVITEVPKPTDSARTHIYNAVLSYEFFNKTRDIVFNISFSCYLTDVKYDRSLGSGAKNISYPLGVIAYGFFNNKKLKITQRDYQRTQNHDVLSDPEMSFPKKRLETFKKTAKAKQFRREDMVMTLKNKIDAGEWYDNQFTVRLGTNPRKDLVFRRGTFQRMPYWDVNFYVNGKYQQIERAGVLLETEETARFLIDLANGAKKQNPDNIVSWLNRQISAHKSTKGQ